MSIPHATSANYYDFVYERRYLEGLPALTRKNLKKIQEFAPKGKLLDFGAGTGRISIPLAKDGYKVTAVDCSSEMVEVLKSKAKTQNLNIDTFSELSKIDSTDFDMAISVFTVLGYITEKEEIKKVFDQIYNLLKSGGYYMFDLESKSGYEDIVTKKNGVAHNKQDIDFKELVTVDFKFTDKNLCQYNETVSGELNEEEFSYSEEFIIKFWTKNEIHLLLKELGFLEIKEFNYGNTDYFIFQKALI
jgi:ubiquinone/menaquinone biosynthesis C-methylase UbiE